MSRTSCSTLTLTDYGKLVSVLCTVQVVIHAFGLSSIILCGNHDLELHVTS